MYLPFCFLCAGLSLLPRCVWAQHNASLVIAAPLTRPIPSPLCLCRFFFTSHSSACMGSVAPQINSLYPFCSPTAPLFSIVLTWVFFYLFPCFHFSTAALVSYQSCFHVFAESSGSTCWCAGEELTTHNRTLASWCISSISFSVFRLW